MKVLAILAIAMLPAPAAASAIFRCTSPAGEVTYQEIPCPASATGGATPIRDAYPEINHAERNRLLQREAALDARLLKKQEMESIERIAMGEQVAREREAQALAARRESESSYAYAPAWVVMQPARGPRVRHHHRPILPQRF